MKLWSGTKLKVGSLSKCSTTPLTKRTKQEIEEDDEEDEDDEEPVRKRSRKNGPQDKQKKSTAKSAKTRLDGETKEKSKACKINECIPHDDSTATVKNATVHKPTKSAHTTQKTKNPKQPKEVAKASKAVQTIAEEPLDDNVPDAAEEDAESEEDVHPEVVAKAREKLQSTLKGNGKDPYPDWPAGSPVPYAALCTTFSLIELTTKRLIILSHCSLFLRQVLRLTPQDVLPTVQLMINKLAADYAGIELGIGESLIMKAIGESTGRSLATIKADQNEIGDLGLVAAKSRSNQPTMFKPKALTVRGVHEGLMAIATSSGHGSQEKKVAGIKKLLSSADAHLAGKGGKGVDITKDKGGASEAKFIVRFLEGKLRLGLADKTVQVAVAQAMVCHETAQKGNKTPSAEKMAKGESIFKTVYR